MAHQHRVRPCLDARLEGEKVGGLKGLIGPLIHGHAGVGVLVVSIAREMLQHRADALLAHGGHHLGHIVGGGLGVLAQGALIDKVGGVGGYVGHRGEVHVDPQVQQGDALLPGVLENGVQPALGVQHLGGGLPAGKQVGVAAGPDHRAPLLIGADEHGDAGGRLIGGDLVPHLLGGLILEVPAKEDIAPQLVLGHLGRLVGLGAADEEHLSHLLLHRHGGHQLLDDLVLVLGEGV